MTPDTPSRISKDVFRQAMSLFPGAVTLITTGTGAGRRGMTATAVCSLTDSPPSLLVCVNRASATCDEIARNGRFSVQLLSEADRDLALLFAGSGGVTGADKFHSADWSECRARQPRLNGALASLSCAVADTNTVGSHTVFIGQISEVCLSPEREALIYARSAFRALAPAA